MFWNVFKFLSTFTMVFGYPNCNLKMYLCWWWSKTSLCWKLVCFLKRNEKKILCFKPPSPLFTYLSLPLTFHYHLYPVRYLLLLRKQKQDIAWCPVYLMTRNKQLFKAEEKLERKMYNLSLKTTKINKL